jgi:isohexenylglutaconyl-CoA hydratase
MTVALPVTETLALSLQAGVLHVTLNRPDRRNAMNSKMVAELIQVFEALPAPGTLRAVVLRGAGGTFCAGADIKDMAGRGAGTAGATPPGPEELLQRVAQHNRLFGRVASAIQAAPAPVIGVIEGAAMGGGFGMVCVTDIALCLEATRFGLPETGLGILPAQIAPFVLGRIGFTQARRLCLTGARFDGREAQRLGLVHEVCADTAALDARLAEVLQQIRRCAPDANAQTKRLLLRVGEAPLAEVLDEAAQLFARASLSEEGREGAMAFVEKRLPRWAEPE